MKTTSTAWQRLVTAARQAPVTTNEAAPYGFATRVAALAMAAERPTLLSSINRFSWRALALSLMVMAVSIATNYSSISTNSDTEQDASLDPVEEYLTIS
ncbi:MAG: hypothetical protein QM790_00190 [Nibricoccus sp.]